MFRRLFHLFVADRRATARTTATLSHAATSQKKQSKRQWGITHLERPEEGKTHGQSRLKEGEGGGEEVEGEEGGGPPIDTHKEI